MNKINIKKYLFENYNDDTDIDTKYLELNMKHDKTFYKFVKICMKYKIYLTESSSGIPLQNYYIIHIDNIVK